MFTSPLSTSLSFGLAIAWALTGCVTTGDVNKLEKRLTEQLQAMEARSQPQVDALRTELQEIRAAQDALREDVTKKFAEIRAETKAGAEAVRQGEAHRAQMQEALQAEIGQNRKALSQYAGQSAKALQQIAEQTGQMSAEMKEFHQAVMHSLVGNYRAEEAALRERLKAVVETRQQLESAKGAIQTNAPKSNGQTKEARAIE